jgi:serine/threonine protein kinase
MYIPTTSPTDFYLCTTLMDTDLDRLIASAQPLSDEHVKYIVYQLIRGCKYLHSANIVHRDLKPSNILVNRDCQVKVCCRECSRCRLKRGLTLTNIDC